MNLSEYIIKRGEEPLAKELDVSVATVQSWRYGRRQPTVRIAKQLMMMTKGVLSWEDIYGPVEENDSAS